LGLPGGPVAPEFTDVGDRLASCGDVLEERHIPGNLTMTDSQ
jgi:hypothetical protein